MEFLLAILMYLGLLSPDATTTMTTAEMDCIIQQNKTVIEQTLQDPDAIVASTTAGVIIDRRED